MIQDARLDVLMIIWCPGRLSGGSHFHVGVDGAEGVTSRWRGINRGNRGMGAKKPKKPCADLPAFLNIPG